MPDDPVPVRRAVVGCLVIALIGFGLDSVVEVASATAVLWQFSGRDPEARERAALRIIAVLISPVMPDAAGALWAKLGGDDDLAAQRFPVAAEQGAMPVGAETTRGDVLFPRLGD